MGFHKHIKSKNRQDNERCDECGELINIGDVYWTHLSQYGRKPEHYCEDCYDKKFVVV
jgi:hypothetical protein